MRKGQQVGRRLPVTWVDIDEPDPEYTDIADPRGVFPQGYAKGGALFNRLEGCWEDNGRSSSCPRAAETPRTAT